MAPQMAEHWNWSCIKHQRRSEIRIFYIDAI